jgi:hypothetical protein
VNEAWKRAGKPGTISKPLMHLVRSEMGITKKRGGKAKRKAAVARMPVVAAAVGTGPAPTSAAQTIRTLSIAKANSTALDFEAEIDRLLFKVIEEGGMSDVEDALRAARRRVILRNGR